MMFFKYVSAVLTILALAIVMAPSASAQATIIERQLFGKLSSFQEVPAVVSRAEGAFRGTMDLDAMEIDYRLRYRDLESDVTQIHIHIGQKGVNGAVAVFLCSNLASAGAGTPRCPARDGQVTGTIAASDILAGAVEQGVDAGDAAKLFMAIRAGVAYVNVHTVEQPAGAIRGQIYARPVRLAERPSLRGR